MLRPIDSHQHLSYSLAATFLGRMCLLGNVHSLAKEQWEFSKEYISLYNCVAPIIAVGRWQRFGKWSSAWRHLSGWQVAVCHAPALGQKLIVWHR